MIKTAKPAPGSQVTVYTADKRFYSSSIFVCATQESGLFSLGFIPVGDTEPTYIYKDMEIRKNETFNNAGFAFETGDIIVMQTTAAGLHFVITGDYT